MSDRRYAPHQIQSALDRATSRLVEVPLDILDLGDAYRIEADLPGYQTDDIDVTVLNDVLRIEATPRGEDDDPPERGIRRRVVRLPEPVTERSAEATFQNGVLEIRIEKRESASSRSVDVE